MKTLLLIITCAVSCSGQEADSFNFRVGFQLSPHGIYFNYGAELILQVSDRFSFRPKVQYLHKPYMQKEVFHNSHIRTVPIAVTYSTDDFNFSINSGTILPMPKQPDPDGWGFLPYLSFQVERDGFWFKNFNTYFFVDLYRKDSPIFKWGVYYRIP